MSGDSAPVPSDPDPLTAPWEVHQSAWVIGSGNRVVQAGRDVVEVVLPPEALVPVTEVAAPPGMTNLPLRPPQFVGRTLELARLDAVLAEHDMAVVAAVHGLGGVGKSTLVAQWAATRAHARNPVWWITADSPSAVQEGLAAFATVLQPALTRVLDVELLAGRGLQWLASHDGWLLVLDNVSDPHDIDHVLAGIAHTGGRVIVTSRVAVGWQHAGTVVRVDVLDPAESLALLTGIVTAAGDRDLDGAAELCAELGHLPLAIEQAGAFLAQNPFTTPRAFLALLTRHPAAMLARGGVATAPERTLARIWRVTLDRLATTEPFAVELLLTLAWYAPDAIPVSLIDSLADPPLVHAAIGALNAYSMISSSPATGTVSVHRLVQAVARTPDPDDPHRLPAAIERARDHAVAALADAFPPARTLQDPATWPQWRALLAHGEALADHVTPDTDDLATVLSTTAMFLASEGLETRAIPLYERALAYEEQAHGPDDPRALRCRNGLAVTCIRAGDPRRGAVLLERTLRGLERLAGADHPSTLTCRANLAGSYSDAGDLSRAITLYKQTLAATERALGADHPDTLRCRRNLAATYEAAGDPHRAIPLYERTLEAMERTLGPDHPSTLDCRKNLAGSHALEGRLAAAIPLYERNLATMERVLGADHPSTLESRNDLSVIYQSAGDLQRAATLNEQALSGMERVLGADHPSTLKCRNNLAIVYAAAGDLQRAIPMYEKALTGMERVLHTDHPVTLMCRTNLATAYAFIGDRERAIPLCERAVADMERIAGADQYTTLRCRHSLAVVYEAVGEPQRAIPMYAQALADMKRVLGADHPTILSCRTNHAAAHASAGDPQRAIVLLQQVLADSERALGADHPTTEIARDTLSSIRPETEVANPRRPPRGRRKRRSRRR